MSRSPGTEKLFTLEFGNKPLESTNYLLLNVPEKVFGNVSPFELKILNPVIEPLASGEAVTVNCCYSDVIYI